MQPVNVMDVRAFFGGARVVRPAPKEEPTLLLLFRSGELDLTSLTGQNLRDLWCLLRGQPTGRKGSPGKDVGTKPLLLAWCIKNAHVAHLYPEI